MPTLTSMLTPLRHFRYVTNVALVEAVKCPSFHTQLLDRLECTNSKHYFSHDSHSERALHAYALKIFSAEICSLGLTSYSNTAVICGYWLAALTTTNNASILLFQLTNGMSSAPTGRRSQLRILTWS